MMQKIEQVRVSHGVRFFKQGLMERWNLKDYHDINKPCYFCGIYNQEDIDAIKNHRGFKLVHFVNAHGNKFINNFVNLDNLVVRYHPYLKAPNSIIVKEAKFELKDYSMFKPNILGNKIYCYINSDKRKHIYGYEKAIQIQKRIKWEIIFGKLGHSIEDLKKNYYDKCFVNLNLNKTGAGGLTSATELGRMGRKTIINSKFNSEHLINYNNDEYIIELIEEESKKIGTLQREINHHTTGEEWLNVDFWK